MEHSKPVGLSISFLSFHCNLVHDVQDLYAVKPFFFSSFLHFLLFCFFFSPFSLASIIFLIRLHCYAPLVDRQMAPRFGTS
jgi:hypothetical protein